MSRFLKLLSYRVSLDQSETLIKEEFGIECACSGTDQQMILYITDESRKAEVLEFISAKVNLYKSLFKVIVVPEIIRNNNGKILYREMDAIYSI